jgi:hypothetical protein
VSLMSNERIAGFSVWGRRLVSELGRIADVHSSNELKGERLLDSQ